MNPDQQPVTPETAEPSRAKHSFVTSRNTWLAVGLLVLVIVVAGVIIGLTHKTSHNTQQTIVGSGNANPTNLHGVAVGDYAYVDACAVFTPAQQAALFSAASGDALVQEQYAEDGLPVKDTPASGIESNCFRSFADDTAYSGTTLTFAIDQYATASAAKAQYTGYSQTQSELDKANQRIGGNLTTDFTPLGTVANTVYSPSNALSYTLDGNRILSFTALLGTVSNDTFEQALTAAIPAMVRAVAAQKPGYPSVTDPSFGKVIGDSTIKNPCAFFTAADFAKAYGAASDPSNINIIYTHRANEYPPDDTSRGWANNSCERTSYPGSTTGVADIKTELRYYKTAREAGQDLRQFVQQQTTGTTADAKAQTVSGIGDYAVLLDQDDSTSPNYFYVLKGSYVIVLNGQTSGGNGLANPTAIQYQKLAKILAAKL